MNNLIAVLALGLAVVGAIIPGPSLTARAATVEEVTTQISALGPAERETFLAKGAKEEGQKVLATSLGKGVAMKGIQPKYTEFQVTPDFVVGLELGTKLKQYIRDFQKIFGISL